MKALILCVLAVLALCSASRAPKLDNCDICQTLIVAIEGWMENNNTITQVEADLDKICVLFGTPAEYVCDSMVETGVPDIVNYIEQNESPKVVCCQINLCNMTTVPAQKPVHKVQIQKLPTQDNCFACQFLIGEVESYLEENATEQVIQQELQNLCAAFPAMETECDEWVKSEVPQIITWLDENQTPTEVCTELEMCNSTALKMKIQAIPPPKQDCSVCEYVIDAMESWIEKNSSIAEVEADLDNVCELIPGFVGTCDAIVAEGVPEVVQWIEKNEDPLTVCTQLGECTSIPPPNQDCSMCEYVVDAMESWVEENSTIEEVETDLDTACNLIPAFETTCDAIVAEGVPEVVQWIEKNEDPLTVCTQLGECTSPKPKPKPKKPTLVILN